MLRCGFQISVLIQGLGMICGWFLTDRSVRRIRLGTVLGIAAILHFPYPLVRLVLSEGFRLNPHRDKIETFKTKWLLLALLAPAKGRDSGLSASVRVCAARYVSRSLRAANRPFYAELDNAELPVSSRESHDGAWDARVALGPGAVYAWLSGRACLYAVSVLQREPRRSVGSGVRLGRGAAGAAVVADCDSGPGLPGCSPSACG